MKSKFAQLVGLAALFSGCEPRTAQVQAPVRHAGATFVVRDTLVPAVLEATGTARPRLSADLSTRLMGKILSVSVKEGDRVRDGQVLVNIDGADLDARAQGVVSGLDASHSQLTLAEVQARRMRSLVADSAAPKASLDQAEAELSRARAGLAMVRSQDAELRSIQGYSRIVAPFAGKIVARLVDPGMLASPGMPLLRIEDARMLRLTVTTSTATARNLSAGMVLDARVDGRMVKARVEGVVPSSAGNMAIVNALVDNLSDSLASGAVATLQLPRGRTSARLVPSQALLREGDLVGVWVRGPMGDTKRWIRVGAANSDHFEVLSGLGQGDTVVIPSSSARN